MPQANDPSGLSQGNLLIVSDAVFGTPTANQVTVTSAGSNLPVMDDNEFIEIRDHSDSVNNGLYQVDDAGGTTTGAAILDKVSGANPIANAVGESINVFSALDTTITDMVFANAVAATATVANRIDMTSAGSNIPTLAVGERFEVEAHADADNLGAYEVISINTVDMDYTLTKLLGVAGGNSNEPNTAASESADTVTERKTIMYDTAGLGVYLLEQGGIDATGASGQAVYSKTMIDWLDDSFLRANAPFPMRAIDKDAGKYLIGQDAGGNNSGWNWVDNGAFSIRTRKLLRNAGWDEIDLNGNITARYAGILTVDAVEDPVNDTAFYQFGTDTTVDDTVDLDFAGPVNEAVLFFQEQAQTDLAITATTITRIGGSNITEGYKVGGQVTIRNAEDADNNGTFLLSAVSATVLTSTGLTVNADDTTAILAVDNDNAFRLGLRVRDGDANGKTFAEANLNTINKPEIGNFVFQFPMAEATDLKIIETDANIDANVPYTGMTLTMHATPQARAGLVGGSFNFGYIMDGNNGTSIQCFEWLQRQLRLLTDIDNDADTHIGRAIGLLARFVGDVLEVGSGDGGLTQFPSPDGGGPGLYIDNLNAVSANDIVFFDSLGIGRVNPETIAITLDANQTLNDDSVSDGTLFFDRTIRNTVSDLIITAGTGADGTFDSVGANLPASLNQGAGAYVRVVGLTGGDAVMNGAYQVTALTSTSQWDVTRYDGATIVTSGTASLSVDENPVNTPDAIIVNTNIEVENTTIFFSAANIIVDNNLTIFSIGDFVRVEGSTDNDAIWEATSFGAGTMSVQNEDGLQMSAESAGPTITLTKIVQVPMTSDFTFSFDFDGNVQGGRTVSTSAFVQAKALGRETAQYTESTVQTIMTGVALIIPLVAQGELNVTT